MKRFLLYISFLSLSFFANAQLNTDRVMSIGQSALYFQDYVLSIQYFNAVVKAKPYMYQPYYYRAIAKIQLEDYYGAERDLNDVIERNPFIPMAYYARGFARKRLQKYEEAESDFTKALEFSPENTIFMFNRLEVYEQQKLWDKLLEDLDFLIRRNRDMYELQFEKARINLVMGDTIAALKSFDDMVMRDSTNIEILGGRATVKLMLDDKEGAIVDYNSAIRRRSTNPTHYTNRGIINYQKKNYRGALADYSKAIELDPTSITALFNRALLRNEVGDKNNALVDLDRVLEIDQDFSEAIYQRAIMHLELGYNKKAVEDFTTLINRFPTFIPAYYGRSNAYEKMGDKKKAFLDSEKAYLITQDQKNKKGEEKKIDTSVKIAQDESSIKERAKLFNASATKVGKEDKSLRGDVQNRDFEVINEKNFHLSFYSRDNGLKKKDVLVPLITLYNRTKRVTGDLKIVNNEMPLSEGLINYHFKSIDNLSQRLSMDQGNAELLFARAMDYVMVQDFAAAINDLNYTVLIDSQFALAYFCRANIRNKDIEYVISSINSQSSVIIDDNNESQINTQELKYSYEMIMRDYDRTIELAPEFPYSYFNKANLLAMQKDYKAAISNYTKAISTYNEFGEAYFNRGLTYIYLGEIKQGQADLSKAGELGIYQAYNMLKRMRN